MGKYKFIAYRTGTVVEHGMAEYAKLPISVKKSIIASVLDNIIENIHNGLDIDQSMELTYKKYTNE